MPYQPQNVIVTPTSMQPTPRIRWWKPTHGKERLEQFWQDPLTRQSEWREVVHEQE